MYHKEKIWVGPFPDGLFFGQVNILGSIPWGAEKAKKVEYAAKNALNKYYMGSAVATGKMPTTTPEDFELGEDIKNMVWNRNSYASGNGLAAIGDAAYDGTKSLPFDKVSVWVWCVSRCVGPSPKCTRQFSAQPNPAQPDSLT